MRGALQEAANMMKTNHDMKLSEINPYTFRNLRHQLGHDRPKDQRPMWQRRLSTASAFCRALVACGTHLLKDHELVAIVEAEKAAKIDLVDLLFP